MLHDGPKKKSKFGNKKDIDDNVKVTLQEQDTWKKFIKEQSIN